MESGPTVSGRLHWLVSGSARKEDKFPRQQLIIYFDPQTNEFAEVPMPQCERGTSDVEVFTMREYGDRNSWTKSFVVSAFPGLRSKDQIGPIVLYKERAAPNATGRH